MDANDQTGTAGPERTCAVCKASVAGKPRVKDKRGRYFCEGCFVHVKAKLASRSLQSAGPRDANASLSDSVSGNSGHSVSDGDMSDLMALAAQEAAAAPVRLNSQVACEQCGVPMSPGAVLCVSCGFNAATGQAIKVKTGKVKGKQVEASDAPVAIKTGGKCGRCNYDLSGVKGLRCPECGTENFVSSRDPRLAEDSRRLARAAYRKPMIIIAVSLVLTIVALAAFKVPPLAMLVIAVAIVANFLVGLAVYWVCTIMFIGVDEPFPLMTLRLLAIYAMLGAIDIGIFMVPGLGFILRFAISSSLHVLALMTMMELDYEDARIVTFVTLVVRAVIVFSLVATFS